MAHARTLEIFGTRARIFRIKRNSLENFNFADVVVPSTCNQRSLDKQKRTKFVNVFLIIPTQWNKKL